METILLLTLAGSLAFVAGIFNGLMEVSMSHFKESKISHWNPKFWELFGSGQAWRNKFVDRNIYAKVRNSWSIPFFHKTVNIPKPMFFLTGYHLAKCFWMIINTLSVIPIAILCNDLNGAILCSALLYFPQFTGWFMSMEFLLSNKKPAY